MKTRVLLSSVLVLLVGFSQAHAGFMTYSGFDSGPLSAIPSPSNAATARSNFLSNLSGGVGTEDFEGFTAGVTTSLSLSFPGSSGSITASMTSSSSGLRVLEVNSGTFAGRFPTSGTKLVQSSGGVDFTITFSNPISAFGFYGTDIGDIRGNLILNLNNGSTKTVTLSTGGANNASLLFWGFTDDTASYSSIVFENTGGSDVFGFDDMTVGDAGQVTSGVVPEPSSVAIFGMLGVGAITYRRRRR